MSSLLGAILGPVLGLQPANATSTTGLQILQSTNVDLSLYNTQQSIYTVPAGNTKKIVVTQFALRDLAGAMSHFTAELEIYVNGVRIGFLPDGGGMVAGATVIVSSAVTYTNYPLSATPTITARVDAPGNTGTVQVDLIGYAI